jgi:hypothetical protein
VSSQGAIAKPLVRRVLWALATLAIALKILVPPGMMIGTEAGANQPLPIMLCTSDGMASIMPGAPPPWQDDGGEDDPGPRHQPPCVFAGHGMGAQAPVVADLGRVEFVAFLAATPLPAPIASPGRGLSGPPLPARGPPARLI